MLLFVHERGDSSVFRFPPDISQTYVKRVIGIPGDHIRITNNRLILNGRELDEPYVVHKANFIDPYRANFPSEPDTAVFEGAWLMLQKHVEHGEVVVPPEHYFAMGDNRDDSFDSRYWGFVPRENIIGKPLMIWWSYDAPTEHLSNGNIDMDHMRDLVRNFFTKTRWKRTFRLIRGEARLAVAR